MCISMHASIVRMSFTVRYREKLYARVRARDALNARLRKHVLVDREFAGVA